MKAASQKIHFCPIPSWQHSLCHTPFKTLTLIMFARRATTPFVNCPLFTCLEFWILVESIKKTCIRILIVGVITSQDSYFLPPIPLIYGSSFVLSPYFSRKGGTQWQCSSSDSLYIAATISLPPLGNSRYVYWAQLWSACTCTHTHMLDTVHTYVFSCMGSSIQIL